MILATSELKKLISENNLVDNINVDFAVQGSSIDLCIGETAKIQRSKGLIDLSKDINLDDYYEEIDLAKKYELAPGQYLYASTIEKVKIPEDKCAIILPRSTFARMGIILPISQYANPGYEGHLPIIIYNASLSPIYIPPYYRVMQMLLFDIKGEAKSYGEQCDVKYQGEIAGKIPVLNDVELEEIKKRFNAD